MDDGMKMERWMKPGQVEAGPKWKCAKMMRGKMEVSLAHAVCGVGAA